MNSGMNSPLPEGFMSIEDIQSLPNQQIRDGRLVNLIGFVKDYQPPIQTRGSDFKSTIEVKDQSVQYASSGIKVVIFLSEDQMPQISGVRDAILIRKAKVQKYNGTISLISNRASEFHVLPALHIPPTPNQILNAQWLSTPALSRTKPNNAETTYIISAAANLGDLALPSSQEFNTRTLQAKTVKEKFILLQDAKSEMFCDLLGQVIKIYDGSPGIVTMYISDYTTNSYFFAHAWEPNGHLSDVPQVDEYGNKTSKPKASEAWPGPYGKMSIQLTLFDAHSDFVRDKNVEVNQWVFLRNVQIKYGKMGGCLEGFLRGDPGQYESSVRVEVMKQKEDKGENDARWTAAVRRKRDWEKKFTLQRESFLTAAADSHGKRKGNDDPTYHNSKMRRKERRAATDVKVANSDALAAEKIGLNRNIKCSHPDLQTTPLNTIIRPSTTILDGETNRTIALPFVVGKYKANVRVIGYFPPDVADFAVGRRASEYDMLSDYSGGEDTDAEEFNRSWKSGKGAPLKQWEWRFALQVEDANNKAGQERMWLIVDDMSGQGLLNLDATNLRSKEGMETLQTLKERLCILWGDLEEQLSAKRNAAVPLKPIVLVDDETPSSMPEWNLGNQPDVDSDDENSSVRRHFREGKSPGLKERDANIGSFSSSREVIGGSQEERSVHNKPFTCCIQQYGAKVDEADVGKANAGGGKRWERKFGLFGVVIS